MYKFLFAIYRVLVPKSLRTVILKKNLRKKISAYFKSISQVELNDDQKEILDFLESNQVRIFPYPFHDNYSPDKIDVKYDPEKSMRFIMHDGKRLYFKKRWGLSHIKRAYSDLLREQDPGSPHRYLTDKFMIGENEVIADIGAAEGNFSLSVIEKAKKIYLFEYDREWIEALEATFAPWKEKIEIIGKYVSNRNDDSHIRFDTFSKDNKDVTFLKIDVDGAESEVLEGCENFFADGGRRLKIALCTYHKNDDEKNFTEKLKSHGFTVTPSKGYMINYYDKNLKAPWLRRGLIRAER